ncbi:MAG: hypothetical protein KAY54_07235 [Burkholderiaceae bacterium]|nr:hypothetical protein [Burkholderiaceae bacterium]
MRVLPCPVEIAHYIELLQWHKYKDLDPAIAWLRFMIMEVAQAYRHGLRAQPPVHREPSDACRCANRRRADSTTGLVAFSTWIPPTTNTILAGPASSSITVGLIARQLLAAQSSCRSAVSEARTGDCATARPQACCDR